MTDDIMTDLTKIEGLPTDRANVIEVRIGRQIILTGTAAPESPLGKAMSFLPPAMAGGILAGVLIVASAPIWMVCSVLVGPTAVWVLYWILHHDGGD
jgi:hypothetical protein